MGEQANLSTRFRPGDVIGWTTAEFKMILIERFYSSWPGWESTGMWWQWWIVSFESGSPVVCRYLENALDSAQVCV